MGRGYPALRGERGAGASRRGGIGAMQARTARIDGRPGKGRRRVSRPRAAAGARGNSGQQIAGPFDPGPGALGGRRWRRMRRGCRGGTVDPSRTEHVAEGRAGGSGRSLGGCRAEEDVRSDQVVARRRSPASVEDGAGAGTRAGAEGGQGSRRDCRRHTPGTACRAPERGVAPGNLIVSGIVPDPPLGLGARSGSCLNARRRPRDRRPRRAWRRQPWRSRPPGRIRCVGSIYRKSTVRHRGPAPPVRSGHGRRGLR